MQGRCLLGSIGNDDAVPSQNCCSTVWAALLTPLSHTRLHDVGGVLGLFPDLNSPTQRRFSCSASCTTQGAKRGLTRRELANRTVTKRGVSSRRKSATTKEIRLKTADGEGFEPPEDLHPQQFSRLPP